MFICEIWLFIWYFPQFCTSDMSKYGYLGSVSAGPFDCEITRVDCSYFFSCGSSMCVRGVNFVMFSSLPLFKRRHIQARHCFL